MKRPVGDLLMRLCKGRTIRIRHFKNALKSGRFLEFVGDRSADIVQSIGQIRLKIHVDPRGTALHRQLSGRRAVVTIDLAAIEREKAIKNRVIFGLSVL